MSYVIERKIALEGVTADVSGTRITIRGPKGELMKDFDNPRFNKKIDLSLQGNALVVRTASDNRKVGAVVGTIAGHARNMIAGVTAGYRYAMKINYSHFPITVTVKDGKIEIRNFLGEKGARTADVIGGTVVSVEKDDIVLTGISKDEVGQTAANIEQACAVRGRDRRVFQDGIFITERAVAKER